MVVGLWNGRKVGFMEEEGIPDFTRLFAHGPFDRFDRAGGILAIDAHWAGPTVDQR